MSIQILAKFLAREVVRAERLHCPLHCRSVWIRKLVAVRMVALDTSGPMATNCGDHAETEKEDAA